MLKPADNLLKIYAYILKLRVHFVNHPQLVKILLSWIEIHKVHIKMLLSIFLFAHIDTRSIEQLKHIH